MTKNENEKENYNYFFSIEIRDINIDFDKYYLSTENNYIDINNINDLPDNSISAVTKDTIIPKFIIDEISYPTLYKLFNCKDDITSILPNMKNSKTIKINLNSMKNNKTILSFNIKYPLFSDYYTFLGKSLTNLEILHFPCIILQSSNGYYILKNIIISEKEGEIIEEEITTGISIKPDKFLEGLFKGSKKQIQKKESKLIDLQKVLNEKVLYESNKTELNNKKQVLAEKRNNLNTLLAKKNEFFEKHTQINNCFKEIEDKKNKINKLVKIKLALSNINSQLKEIISLKKKYLESHNEKIISYNNEISNIKTKKIPYLKKINEGLLATNNFLTQYYLNELCYFFFNKTVKANYSFPSFYKVELNDLKLSKTTVEEYFNTYQKEISTTFGNIVLLLTYLSKKFDIILPFSLYYNGSKSKLIINLKEGKIINLYINESEKFIFNQNVKTDSDIQIKVEFLSRMMFDVIRYFNYKQNNNKIEINSILDSNGKCNNIYKSLLKLNELFKYILNK